VSRFLSVFFGIAKMSIEWRAQRYHEATQGNGRPRTLPEAAYAYITDVVQARFTEKKPVTYRLLQDAIEWHFKISMLTDRLRHICRDMPGVKRVVELPVDRARIQYDQNAIAAFYDELEAAIEGPPAEFFYNVDESGRSHWAGKPGTNPITEFLHEHWDEAYSSVFDFHIQPIRPSLPCIVIHVYPVEH
jgi:hypothetical protein